MNPEHGTNARYQQHYREGENACEPCRKARRSYYKDKTYWADYLAAYRELRQMYPGDFLRILYDIRSSRDADSE